MQKMTVQDISGKLSQNDTICTIDHLQLPISVPYPQSVSFRQ